MINQESKRLARMIQTFLDVERLSDGQMELKGEPFRSPRDRRGLHRPRAPARRAQEYPHCHRSAGWKPAKAIAN